MHALKNKIKSRRGASLTFALLLFLVCAVVGSIVLAAGFASAGRLAGLAESEQRYYAVNSAAEYIVSELCKDENKVVIGMKKNADGTYTNTLPTNKGTLPADLAMCLVFGTLDNSVVNTAGSKALYENSFPAIDKFNFEMTVADKPEIPPVVVVASFINGYQLNLDIKNKVEEGKTGKVYELPTIILETDPPRGVNEEDRIEYTFNWRVPKG